MNEQVKYYHKRAQEYELVYQKPERQADLKEIRTYVENQFQGKSILEIGCGTGYWTEVLAQNTAAILASDINLAVLDIAQTKPYANQNVSFEQIDYDELNKKTADFEGLFAGFIWSHIPKEKLNNFLQMCIHQVQKGCELLFVDNQYVVGSSTPISRQDKFGNTYQTRILTSGASFEVLKNFPKKAEIEKIVDLYGVDIQWIEWEYYWVLKFKSKL